MKHHQVIAVLGYGFNSNWGLQHHVLNRLKIVKKLWENDKRAAIAVCGKWTFYWDIDRIIPPATEAQLMKKALIEEGVPEEKIIKEEKSKDTIGNLFYLKQIMKKHDWVSVLVVGADFHEQRVKFIIKKVFEPMYKIDLYFTKTEKGNTNEMMQLNEEIIERYKKFLKDMKRGDDEFLAKRLYNDPRYQKKYSSSSVAKGNIN